MNDSMVATRSLAPPPIRVPTVAAVTTTTPPPPAEPGRYRRRTRARNLRAGSLTVLGWASVSAAIALYLAYGGMFEFDSLPHALKALGILAGLVATDLMCLMLLLAARIPYVDRAFGHDHAVALHSKLGKYVLYGLAVHAWLLLSAYAANDGLWIVGEFLSLWTGFDFVIAVIALGLLAVAAVTSIVAVKRRFGYEIWHAVHLTTYVAVGLSIPHQFSMSGLFAEGTWQRWYWIALYAVTAFALLTFRVLLPIFTSIEHGLVVSRVVREADDVVSIEMTGRNLPALDVAAGQFLHWRFLAKGLWWHQHPFSVSAAPTATALRITVRALGAGTGALLATKPGTRVMIEGPYGIFSDAARTTERLTLVGIGIGIAPIRAILESTAIVPGRATVILRASRAEQLYLVREIDALCRARGARLITLIGPRATRRDGTTSWVPRSHAGQRLADMVPHLAASDVYVCGPQAASDLVIADALAAGVPAASLHNESFSW